MAGVRYRPAHRRDREAAARRSRGGGQGARRPALRRGLSPAHRRLQRLSQERQCRRDRDQGAECPGFSGPGLPRAEAIEVNRRDFDVIVAGAGAAGLMCAIRAGQRGRRVLLLEHADKVGKKILISGGGRCNFTNLLSRPEAFLSANPHFCKSALARYTQHDFIALVDKHCIAWHKKTLGQLFCDGSARQIVAMLLAECEAAGVDVRVAHRPTAIEKTDRFIVRTDKDEFEGAVLVLASGGLSIPKMGATGFAHDTARRFGLKIDETRPALVPFTARVPELSGVSLPVEARCGKAVFREAMLFTHRGLSGPAILQISSYWQPGQEISIDLLPDLDAAQFLKERRHLRPKAELK